MHTPRTLVSILLSLGLGLTACGSSEPTPAAPEQQVTSGGEAEAPHEEAMEAHHEGQEHHALPADLAAFHDALASVWHSEPGDGRAQAACEAAANYVELAASVNDGEALAQASSHLIDVCATPETAAVEEALTGVHQAFHDNMEARQPAE